LCCCVVVLLCVVLCNYRITHASYERFEQKLPTEGHTAS
jgi:hypothetical protein